MGHRHLSRRDVLESIVALGSGGLLQALGPGARAAAGAVGVIRGQLRDAATGAPVAAKLRVTSGGQEFFPEHAIRTMPRDAVAGRRHYFYARGSYEIAVPPGRYDIE